MNRIKNLDVILKSLGAGFINLGNKGFVYGSQGKLVRRNVESLWFDHCVTIPPFNVFLASSDMISETLRTLRETSCDRRPFGLASIDDTKTMWNSEFHSPDYKSYTHKIGKVTIVTNEENSKDVFHRTQRERKVWWRKLARNPSRFALTEAKKIGKNRETIDIIAKFPFGNMVVETIVYQQDGKKNYSQIDEHEDDSPPSHVVEHTASLDWGCLAMLCDGYELEDTSGELKIHPKLSPYKVGFYLETDENEDDQKSQEKTRLVVYLNNLLKSKGLCTILTRTKQGIQNFHVPLTVSVDDASLQNGIVRVTHQLTTIAEAVHVSDLPKYVAARCN